MNEGFRWMERRAYNLKPINRENLQRALKKAVVSLTKQHHMAVKAHENMIITYLSDRLICYDAEQLLSGSPKLWEEYNPACAEHDFFHEGKQFYQYYKNRLVWYLLGKALNELMAMEALEDRMLCLMVDGIVYCLEQKRLLPKFKVNHNLCSDNCPLKFS